jgi:hypothetical protein
MGKFLLGLIIGLVVGVLVVAYNPNLPDEVRATLANLTGLVLRGTEEAAQGIGEAADEVADEARQATDRETGDAVDAPPEPATPTEGADRPAQPRPGGEPPPAD